jgi:hypothetical protein
MRKKTLNGTCGICRAAVTSKEIQKHLQVCLKRNTAGGEPGGKKKPAAPLFHLRVEGYGLSQALYWMHLKVLAAASFRDLDLFLRKTWLECCGHMSAFYPEGEEVAMTVKLGDALRPGQKLLYEYDFGTTTELLLTVISELDGGIKKGKAEIIARNDAPPIQCVHCQSPATTICTECFDDSAGWLCDDCAAEHDCDPEMFLPLVNSPRTGLCGYEGAEGE